MLTLLSTLLGFTAPFLPELVKFFNRRQDLAHELEMFKLRMQQGAAEHTWKMEEINATADIAEAAMLHQAQPSFGVQILDRAHDVWGSGRFGQLLIAPVFWAFAFMDWVNGMVRPTIAYWAFGSYMIYRYSCVKLAMSVAHDMTAAEAVAKVWSENDWAVLMMVLAFYFGERTRKAVFGGSSNTASAGR